MQLIECATHILAALIVAQPNIPAKAQIAEALNLAIELGKQIDKLEQEA